MAFSHGKNLKFKIDNAAGALSDITAYVDNVEIGSEVDMGETTTAGAEDKTYVSGQHGFTVSISGKWDDTATTGPDAILTGLRGLETTSSFEYGPNGSAAGKIKKTGEVFLKSYTVTSPASGVNVFTADFQGTGAVTEGVWP